MVAGFAMAGLAGCKGDNVHTSDITSESSEIETYTVTWKNYDGRILERDRNVPKGTMPEFNGSTPTREDSEAATYEFRGWTPALSRVVEDVTYTATYQETLKTFTITFPDDNWVLSYSQHIVEGVGYGTEVHINENIIEIGGIYVEANIVLDQYERDAYNYVFTGWNIPDGYVITGNNEFYINYEYSPRLYDLTIVATDGGLLHIDGYEGNRDSFFFENGKSYISLNATNQDTGYATDEQLHLVDEFVGFSAYYDVTAIVDEDPLYDITFDGWYANGERIQYHSGIQGDATIEARFIKVKKDNAHIFEYEFDSLRREAAIVGVKEEYRNTYFPLLVIPETYEGYNVTVVKARAFYNASYNNLYIPKTLMYFEESDDVPTQPVQADYIILDEESIYFKYVDGILYNYDMTTLVTSTKELQYYVVDGHYDIPDTVNYIFSWGFTYNFPFLTSVTLPNTITKLAPYSLACNWFETLEIPSSVTTMDFGSVSMMSHLESITIPDSVVTIEGGMFAYCSDLKYIHFGKGLQTLDSGFGQYARSLLSITVDSDNPYFASYNGALYNKDLTKVLRVPSGLTEFPVSNYPSSLRTIGNYCFFCTNIESIIIPEGVERLDSSVVHEARNLSSIHLPSTLKQMGGSVFTVCRQITEINFAGTIDQWSQVVEDPYTRWYAYSNITKVICSDGVVEFSNSYVN